jgi:hypothetical protein
MKSLKEICKLAVIKQGLSRTDLPQVVSEEVEIMEEKLKSVFSGIFFSSKDDAISSLKIAWENGEWQLTPLNQETLRIRAGVENSLGREGGDIFCLPGRQVSIHHFRIDLDGRKVFFYGSCSSVKNSTGRQFESLLTVMSNKMWIYSKVFIRETGKYKRYSRFSRDCRAMANFYLLYMNHMNSDCESDSSVDYEIVDSDPDENSLETN